MGEKARGLCGHLRAQGKETAGMIGTELGGLSGKAGKKWD